jgi:hypothetical protein
MVGYLNSSILPLSLPAMALHLLFIIMLIILLNDAFS